MSRWRFYGTVAKDGSHIRTVASANSLEMAEILLITDWTPALIDLYEIKPVIVMVDESQSEADSVIHANMHANSGEDL